jgi:Cu-Zn family superoxide dismutase
MTKTLLSTALVVAFVAANGTYASAKDKPAGSKTAEKAPTATAPLEAKSGSKVTGTATFTQKGKDVTVVVNVENAPPGKHAVHIHDKGDCSSPDGKSAGDHWNPSTDQHGAWSAEHHHLGDIGNMDVGPDGKGTITLTTNKWAVAGAPTSDGVIGHAIIVHGGVDDFKTQPTGNAGPRIACGVIAAPAAK